MARYYIDEVKEEDVKIVLENVLENFITVKKNLKLRVGELAEIIDTSDPTAGNILRGLTPPSLLYILRICKRCGYSLNDFIYTRIPRTE